MKKRIAIKIIGGAIIFSLAMFFLSGILPLKASAASSTGLNWSNPNANGNNPYKFKPADVLNSQMIMQVVGCTGVVDKISSAITGLFQKNIDEKMKKLERDAVVKFCSTTKGSSEMAAATIMNTQITNALKDIIDCKAVQQTKSDEELQTLIDNSKKEDATKRRDECFNGIAITLARNQLTAMTKYTMNWVNSGFSGNPMYVQNITTLTNKISQDAIKNGVLELTKTDKAYPYGASFSTAIINNYKSEGALANGASNFLSSMTSTLNNFVTDPQSYKFTSTTPDKRTPAQKAKDLNKSFANDFSLGGWGGWLGLTMNEQNNPLGFSMEVSQYLTDQANIKNEATKNEIAQNNGFLSQKKCAIYNDEEKSELEKSIEFDTTVTDSDCAEFGEDSNECMDALDFERQDRLKLKNFVRTCLPNGWEVVTPGSLIKDKVSTYVNSPERQLELADTINKSLNSLFTALITKFQDQGLSGLSSEKYQYTSTSMGGGPGADSVDLFSSATGGSGYSNGSFDLTHDLGNRFIHGYKIDSIGNWNAQINEPQLAIGVAPLTGDGKTPWESNVFYTVKNGVGKDGKGIVGQTKLFENGYNNWENGDRAFWDGTGWQNWKKTTVDKNGIMMNTSPIAKRGVIQIQKDYVVAAKQILMNLPRIMPQIGELDYCIPGPNPNWRATTSEVSSLFGEYAGTLRSQYQAGNFFALRRPKSSYSMAQPGDPEYDNYRSVFKYTDPSWWTKITSTRYWTGLNGLASMGTQKGAKKIAAAEARVGEFLDKLDTDTRIFNDIFANYIDNLYGPKSPMQTQFIETEDTPDLKTNMAWLPISSEGLDITKNITSYNEDIITTANDYKDTIIKANANISKLSLIKDKVSVIIRDAQKRRYDKLKKAAIDNSTSIQYNKDLLQNSSSDILTLSEAEYKKKYANCLAEEEIVYYDDLSIMGAPNDEKNRCSDGLDNDLDGLVDDLDPDCKNYTIPVEPKYVCVLDLTDDPSNPNEDGSFSPFLQDNTNSDPFPDDTTFCNQRTSSECTLSLYYNNGLGMRCKLSGN